MGIEQELKGQVRETLIQLVTIASPTGAVEEFQKYLTKRLEDYQLQGGKDRHENLVYHTPDFNAKHSLLLTSHIDTVNPGENIKPIVVGDWIKTDGTTILGADPKAGIAAVLTMLEYFKRKEKTPKNIELVFSTNEEEGDHTLKYARIASKKAIVLDNGAPIKEIEYCWPAAQVFLIEVRGKKEIHAQLDCARGRNAIAALAAIIQAIPWGAYADGCVSNTGTISGGKSTTIVPDYAFLKGNIYCFKHEDLNSFMEKVRKTCAEIDNKFKTKTTIKIVERYRGVKTNLASPFIAELKEAYVKNGVHVSFVERLLVNCNNCLKPTIQSVNVGLGHKNIHTVREQQSVSQLARFTKILIDIIEKNYV